MEAIPPDRREPIALQGAVDRIGLEQSSEVLRLAPTAAVAERFLAAIERFAAAAKGDTKRLLDTARKGIDAVASQHPPLQNALAKKRACGGAERRDVPRSSIPLGANNSAHSVCLAAVPLARQLLVIRRA